MLSEKEYTFIISILRSAVKYYICNLYCNDTHHHFKPLKIELYSLLQLVQIEIWHKCANLLTKKGCKAWIVFYKKVLYFVNVYLRTIFCKSVSKTNRNWKNIPRILISVNVTPRRYAFGTFIFFSALYCIVYHLGISYHLLALLNNELNKFKYLKI